MTRQRILLLAFALSVGPFITARAQRAGRELRFEATLLLSAFRNAGRVTNADVPTIALLPDQSPLGSHALGATIRQTRLRAFLERDSVLGATLAAEIDVDFFGGQQPSGGGRTHPLPRLRRAYGELRWSHASLLVGQEAPPLFGVNPVSVGSVGFPLFASSGNLWLWLPQIRATAWLTPDRPVRVGIEGSLLAPNAGEPVDPFLTQPDRAELTDRPALEGRVLARWAGGGGREGEVGVGGHAGWLKDATGRLIRSRAFGVSAAAPLGRWAEIRGEYFRGRALAGLGGGGIGQNLTVTGDPVRTSGGWVQGIVGPTAHLEFTLGIGRDDPDDRDQTGAARSRNQAVAAGAIWRPAPLVIGLEVRWLKTDYLLPAATARSTHLNLGLGIEF